MELDDLKSLWKKQDQVFQQKNQGEIAMMIKGSSNSIISKLKRSVWIELVFTLIAGLALLIYALSLEPSVLKNISISILVLFMGYTVYYIKKLILLNKFDTSGDNISVNLENLIKNLSGYLKYYKLSYTILYPVYFFMGVVFGGLEGGAEHFFDVLTETRTIWTLIAIGIVFYLSSTWLVKWFLKKMYGNHLEKLKNLLNDIHN